MFIPYKVDVPMQRWPLANWALIAVICIASIAVWLNPDEHAWRALALHRGEWFHPLGLLTSTFVHADIFHLAGNMFFLFLFGNALNARLGHWQFLALYFLAGLFSDLAWVAFGSSHVYFMGLDLGIGDVASIGASGAIMGIVGMFLILYPRNNISVYWGISVWYGGTFELSAYWIIALYVAFDIWGLLHGTAGIGYLAHVAGATFGIAAMAALVKYNWVAPFKGEENLLQVFGFKPKLDDLPTTRSTSTAWSAVSRQYLIDGHDRTTGFKTSFTTSAHSESEARLKAQQEQLVVDRIQVL